MKNMKEDRIQIWSFLLFNVRYEAREQVALDSTCHFNAL